MSFIEFRNVSLRYPSGTMALRDVSFSIEQGEFVFLIGESGAGKSTLFKLLTREVRPTSGQVLLDGCDLTRLKERHVPLLRRKIGVVFQDFRLLDSRTVGENVAFAMEIIGKSPKEIRLRVPLVLTAVGLRDKMDASPRELSGGERQRVCIARALVNQPEFIIADEPTGDLDPVNGEAIMALLNRINVQNKTTVITCTHDMHWVERMRRRVVQIRGGILVRDDACVMSGDDRCCETLTERRRQTRQDDRQKAEAIRQEIEDGEWAMARLRSIDDDFADRRVDRMRETARHEDFYEQLRRSTETRRNRPSTDDRRRWLHRKLQENESDGGDGR